MGRGTFFRNGYIEKNSSLCVSECLSEPRISSRSHVYPAAFLLLLLSEVCVVQIGPLGVL